MILLYTYIYIMIRAFRLLGRIVRGLAKDKTREMVSSERERETESEKPTYMYSGEKKL